MNFMVLCLCASLSGVLSEYLNLEEGDECEWEGLQGKCVEETRCLTTIDDDSPKHAVCYKDSEKKIICCTDCELVNSTKNAIFIRGGVFFKNGQKARDKCLQYIAELPYKCKESNYYAGISRDIDDENKCYRYSEWEVEGTTEERETSAYHPYLALLGYGKELASAIWYIRGVIISNKYILTTGYALQQNINNGSVISVAVGGIKSYDILNAWETHSVKRVLVHPNFTNPYVYNNIGLIETVNTITFKNNVLPACLPVEAAADETAITPTWSNLKSEFYQTINTVQTINLDKFSEEECKQAYVNSREKKKKKKLNNGQIYDTQMCYGSRSHPNYTCKVNAAQPLLINTQFSRCVYTVIGLHSLGFPCPNHSGSPKLFNRVAPYIPWIESVVWDGV